VLLRCLHLKEPASDWMPLGMTASPDAEVGEESRITYFFWLRGN
jgi:hypothetical protein